MADSIDDEILTEEEGIATPTAPQPPQGPRSDYDDILDQEDDDRVADIFRLSIAGARDRLDGIESMAKESGVPIANIERVYDDVRKGAEAAKLDPKRFKEQYPDLYRMIANNPTLAGVVYKDEKISLFSRAMTGLAKWKLEHPVAALYLETLGPMQMPITENLLIAGELGVPGLPKLAEKKTNVAYQQKEGFNTFDMMFDTFGRGWSQNQLASLGTQQIIADANLERVQSSFDKGKATDTELAVARQQAYDVQREIIQLQQQMSLEPDYGENPAQRFLIDATQGVASYAGMMKGMFVGGGAGAVVGGVAAGVAARNPAAIIPGMKVGGQIGMKIGLSLKSFEQETGSQYLELRDATDADGKPIDRDVAMGAAVLYGLAAAGVENMTEFGILGGAGKGYVVNQGLRPLLKEVGRRFFRGSVLGAPGEGIEETIQETLGILDRWAATGVAPDPQDAAKQAFEAGWKGAAGGVAIGAMHATMGIAGHTAEVHRSQRSALQVAELTKVAESSTVKAAPRAVAKMVIDESRRQGRPIDGIFVDPARLTEVAELAGMPANELVQTLMGDGGKQRMQEALARRFDQDGKRASLEVSVEEYLEKWGPHPIAQMLLNDMTAARGAMTMRELEQAGKFDQKAEESRAKDLLAAAKESGEWEPASPGEERLLGALTERLTETKKYDQATVNKFMALHRAKIETLSARTGIAVDDLFDRETLKFRKEDTLWNRQLSDFRAMPLEQRRGEYYRDRNTGLLNERGLDVAKRDPSRPMLAEWDLEGFKLLNDKFGHEVPDAALRQMANVIRKHVPDAAKIGGQIRAFVADQAQADLIGKEMQEAIDSRLRVTSATAAHEGRSIRDTLQETGKAHKSFKEAEVAAKRLGAREGAPAAFASVEDATTALQDTVNRLRTVGLEGVAELGPEHVEAFGKISTENAFADAYRDNDRMLSELGFHEAQKQEPTRYVMSADARGFKMLNEAFGRHTTDAIASIISQSIVQLGGEEFQAARLHGDEFAGGHDDPDYLNTFFGMVQDLLRDIVIFRKNEDGSLTVQDGLYFAYGIGTTFDEADRIALPAAKLEQDNAGAATSPTTYRDGSEAARAVESLRAAGRIFVNGGYLAGAERQGTLPEAVARGRSEATAAIVEDILRLDGDPDLLRAEIARPGSRLGLHAAEALAKIDQKASEGLGEEQVSQETLNFAARVADALTNANQNMQTPDDEVRVSPTPEVLDQPQNFEQWLGRMSAWMRQNDYSKQEIEAHVGAVTGQMKIWSALGPAKLEQLPRGEGPTQQWMERTDLFGERESGEGVPLGPLRTNEDDIYILSFDASTNCVKRLEYASTVRAIEKELKKRGKPRSLELHELVALAVLFRDSGRSAPCLYCYVESKRSKAAALVNRGVRVLTGEEKIPGQWKDSFKKKARDARAEAKKLGLKTKDIDFEFFVNPDRRKPERLAELQEKMPAVTAYLLQEYNGASANVAKAYSEYSGELLAAPESFFDKMKMYAGFRFFSSSDFQPEHVVDIMQAVHDLALRESPAHAYTKTEDFVRIFGNTNMKIQTSIFGERDESGNLVEDTWQGMGWDLAKKLRAEHPNVGTVFVATDDDMVRWALDQDWIDYIIPFHASGMEKRYFSLQGWQNFTSTQREKWAKKGKKGKVPKIRMHELGVADGITDEEMTKRYLELCKKRGLRPVFAKFADHPKFAKLKKDFARTDTPFRPVVPNFNMEHAEKLLEKFFRGETPKAAPFRPVVGKMLKLLDKAQPGEDLGVRALEEYRKKQGLLTVQRLEQQAWHGTPFRGIERFSTEKIGTGEGAQVYGWGLYFARNKAVAELYRSRLSSDQWLRNGEHLPLAEPKRVETATAEELALDVLKTSDSVGEALKRMEARGPEYKAAMWWLQEHSKEFRRVRGQTYKVDVPEDSELLDYDKPFSQQPPHVRLVLRRSGLISTEDVTKSDGSMEFRRVRLPDGMWVHPDEAKGSRIYSALARRFGDNLPNPEQKASETLRILGIPGLRYLDQQSRGASEDEQTHNYVVWNEDAIRIIDTLYQPPKRPGARRGYIDITKDAIKRSMEIVVTEQADLSTVLHELSHAYFEMLGDLAELPDAKDQLKQDWQTALAFVGAADRNSLTVDHKEKWARAWEAYLLEGNAPSLELAALFQRFRTWLLRIYKTVTSLNVRLDDNIRGVFDRMLATDQQIANVRKAMGADKPMEKDESWTDAEYKTYLDERAEEAIRTTKEAQSRVARAQKKAFDSEWKAVLEDFREQAGAEVDARSDVRLHRFLTKGEVTFRDGRLIKDLSDERDGMLDAKEVKKLAAEIQGGDRILKLLRGRLAKKDGLPVSTVANEFKFGSPVDMFKALLSMPDRETLVDQKVQELVKREHPELLDEGERLESVVAQAAHSGNYADILLREWAKLQGKSTILGLPQSDVLKAAARELVRKQPVRVIKLSEALANERKHAEASIAAAAKGDFNKASFHKGQQLLAHYTFTELSNAVDDRDRFEELLGKMKGKSRRSTMGLAGQQFLDVSDQILEALGISDPVTPEAAAERQPVATVRSLLETMGYDVGFDDVRLNAIVGTPPAGGWKGLTIADMHTVTDALSQLYTAARAQNTIMLQGKRVALDKVVDSISKEAGALSDKGKAALSETAGGKKLQDGKNMLRGFGAALVRLQELTRELGPTMYKVIWEDGYLRSRKAEDDLSRAVLEKVTKTWESLPEDIRRRRYEEITDVNGVEISPDFERGGPVNRQWMTMVAFNMGNQSNRQRLLDGFGWKEQEVLDWLDRNMTDAEWRFVQETWDLFDKKLWPKVSEVYSRVNGIPPKKIDATPVQTKFGLMRGGYFPARYDPLVAGVGESQSIEALTKLFGEGRASVVKGFTKERVRKYVDIIDLHSFDAVPAHVASVIHYVAYEEMIRDAAKVVYHPTVRGTVNRRLGQEYYPAIEGGLRRMASFAADAIPKDLSLLYRVLLNLRSRFSLATIGFSLPIAAADTTNPLVTWVAGNISTAGLANAAVQTIPLVTYPQTRREALAASPELRHRAERGVAKLREYFVDIGLGGKDNAWKRFKKQAEQAAFSLFELTDSMTSTVVWKAAYDDAVTRKGLTGDEAIAWADDAVHSSMPSWDAADMPAILADKRSAAAFVQFFGYFSCLGNMWRRIVKERSAPEAFARIVGTIIVANVLGELIGGRGPEDDEEVPEWITRKVLAAPATAIPAIGGLGEEFAGRFTSWMWHGEARKRQVSFRSAPAYSALERLWRAIQVLMEKEDATAMDEFWALLDAVGIVSGTPVGASQVQRTGKYLTSDEGLAEDIDEGDLAGAVEGLTYGPREGKAATPLTPMTE